MQRSSDEIRREGLDALRERLGDAGMVRFLEIVRKDTSPEHAIESPEPTARVIEEKLVAIASEIPKEEWDRLPPDLTGNLDPYVHGSPSK